MTCLTFNMAAQKDLSVSHLRERERERERESIDVSSIKNKNIQS